MVSFQEINRLVNGVSLVAKEFARRSQAIESVKTGDFETLISSSLKKVLVSATDLAGLTKGEVRSVSQPRSKETVVYFTDSSEIANSKPSQEREINGLAQGAESSSVSLANEGTANSKQSREREVSDFAESSSLFVKTNGEEVYDACIPANRIEPTLFDSEISVGTDTREPSKFENSNAGATVELDSENVSVTDTSKGGAVAVKPEKKRRARERRVPSTPFSRALGFAGLGAGLAWGTIQESAKRLVYGAPKSKDQESAVSPFLSAQNAERLALALCRMRGAALKLGQMLSIQDESLVPAPILAALDIVRQGADVMPRSQLNQVLNAELGLEWTSKLQSFDYEPMAAASIGQVHRAVTKDGREVAMKIQYPGVADSIESDIENVKLLLDYTNLIPKGLFLDQAMKVAKEELSRECDYELEAKNQKRFHDLLSENKEFYVPMVIENISSKRVLTTELVSGVPIDKVATLSQETRNYIGKKLLELTLMELFVFHFMQTDPNWSNFLYDEASNMINLIDFGAARVYPKSFVDDYLRMVLACANCDRDKVIEMSRRLGFLTGMESEIMLEAHVQAGFVVGLPFSKPGGYDFRTSNITQSVSNLGATMLRHRLTPPPDEAYSLHRKLSGAFLACIKLEAIVPCRELLLQVYEQYQFGNEGDQAFTTGSMV